MTNTLLLEAHDMITGNRAAEYGDAEEGFNKVAAQWNLYLRQKYNSPLIPTLSAEDICWMMADLKKVRQLTKPKRDNVVDAAGYLGLIEMVGKSCK